MEQTENTTHFEEFDALHVTALSRDYLLSASKWSRILAILGFIGVGFMLLAGVFFVFASNFFPTSQEVPMPFPMSFLGIIYFAIAAIYVYPLISLWRFANQTEKGVNKKDSLTLEHGLMNLGTFFRFLGIMSLVIIGIYILSFIGLAIFGVMV
ncbi:MAG: DUF5362 family protein [Bacteroidota bacterium]